MSALAEADVGQRHGRRVELEGAAQRIENGLGLLGDLLRHVVGIGALAGDVGAGVELLGRLVERLAGNARV